MARREEQVGETGTALRRSREVADGFEAFCRSHAGDAAALGAAIDCCPRLAPALRHAGATDQSRRVVELALRLTQESAASNPDAANLRRLAEGWQQLAKCRMRDEPSGVEAALTESVAAARRLFTLSRQNRFVLDDRLRRLAHFQGGQGRRRQAAACLRECEQLWPKDADGLRGVARNYRELADEVTPSQSAFPSTDRDERQGYLAEAARLEKTADCIRP